MLIKKKAIVHKLNKSATHPLTIPIVLQGRSDFEPADFWQEAVYTTNRIYCNINKYSWINYVPVFCKRIPIINYCTLAFFYSYTTFIKALGQHWTNPAARNYFNNI